MVAVCRLSECFVDLRVPAFPNVPMSVGVGRDVAFTFRDAQGVPIPDLVRVQVVFGGGSKDLLPLPADPEEGVVWSEGVPDLGEEGDQVGVWVVPFPVFEDSGKRRVRLVVNDTLWAAGSVKVTQSTTKQLDPAVAVVLGDIGVDITVYGGGGSNGDPGLGPGQFGDGFVYDDGFIELDATVVRTDDPRMSDARTPLPHTHPAVDVTGLADVATTGSYNDLDDQPSIPSQPTDVGAAPLAHTHPVADVTGLADVATTGDYDDLVNTPTIPTIPSDIGAAADDDPRLTDARTPKPHLHTTTDIAGLADVAETGSYNDLSDTPTIPTTPVEVGAEPAGTAVAKISEHASAADPHGDRQYTDDEIAALTAGDVGADPAGTAVGAVSSHVSASDPHGDRAYTDQTVAALDADDVGAVPADGLPARIVGDGTTATVTGAGTEADPLVVASIGGGGGGGGWWLERPPMPAGTVTLTSEQTRSTNTGSWTSTYLVLTPHVFSQPVDQIRVETAGDGDQIDVQLGIYLPADLTAPFTDLSLIEDSGLMEAPPTAGVLAWDIEIDEIGFAWIAVARTGGLTFRQAAWARRWAGMDAAVNESARFHGFSGGGFPQEIAAASVGAANNWQPMVQVRLA